MGCKCLVKNIFENSACEYDDVGKNMDSKRPISMSLYLGNGLNKFLFHTIQVTSYDLWNLKIGIVFSSHVPDESSP